jgi:GTP cyclohydrolase I
MAEPSDVLRELHPERRFDRDAVVAAVRTILEAIGEDPDRDGLQRTPERVADMYGEIFAGIGHDPATELDVTFEADHDEMIMVRDIPLYSVCEHHLVPFIGRAHVAYIPNEQGDITGLSKLARLVDLLAKRPQVQERLTTQIVEPARRLGSHRGRTPMHEHARRKEARKRDRDFRGARDVQAQQRDARRSDGAYRAR